jgi:septal ring factor EnvC (AmiA/AmiB activator)
LIGILVAAVFSVAFLWRAPKPSVPEIAVDSDVLRGFVDAYEEKEKISSELEAMERQVQKGRIPRRRYKVRRRALEGRLSNLSRDLANFKEKMRGSASGYANMVRQIEVAETELEGLEGDIRRTEIRRRRGEISSEAYHRLLSEYHRRREKARVTIEGMLLRLRTETQ